MSSRRITSFLILMLFFFQGANFALADIYRFKDEKGVWHFTNINNDIRYKLFIRTYAKNPDKYITDYPSALLKCIAISTSFFGSFG